MALKAVVELVAVMINPVHRAAVVVMEMEDLKQPPVLKMHQELPHYHSLMGQEEVAVDRVVVVQVAQVRLVLL